MPRATRARSRPAAALLAVACAASAAATFTASAAAPSGMPLPSPPPALRSASIERAVVLHDDRFVLRASTTRSTRPDAQHGNAGLALRAARLSAKGADACAEGAIFKDGFEQP